MVSLIKYQQTGSFFFYSLDRRKDCFSECNAPSDASGIYLIYGIRGTTEELVYIGSSGKLINGEIQRRASGLGGIKGRLIDGNHRYSSTGKKVTRYLYWKERMIVDSFDRLRIDWFVTHSPEYKDCPFMLEEKLIEKYKPRWNRKIPKE